MKVALHWFRCDLRLYDNTALYAAGMEADIVVPLFIFDPHILSAPDTGAPIVGFMLGCLASLEKNIAAAGGKLIFRHGRVEEEMRDLLRATGAQALYFNRDYEPEARKRDAAVEKVARSLGVGVHSYKDGVLHEPAQSACFAGGEIHAATGIQRSDWSAFADGPGPWFYGGDFVASGGRAGGAATAPGVCGRRSSSLRGPA
jgi:deoxyribodipyrimidine photo-lyase